MTDFCRFYPSGGRADNTHCEANIDMDSVRDASVPYRYPCFDPSVSHLCPHHAPYTAQERAEQLRGVADVLRQMNAFEARTSEACPHCGAHVTALDQVGKCVYARPCGCRIGQMNVPSAWA